MTRRGNRESLYIDVSSNFIFLPSLFHWASHSPFSDVEISRGKKRGAVGAMEREIETGGKEERGRVKPAKELKKTEKQRKAEGDAKWRGGQTEGNANQRARNQYRHGNEADLSRGTHADTLRAEYTREEHTRLAASRSLTNSVGNLSRKFFCPGM